MSLWQYKYYDTPEGQDIYKKVFVTSKYAAMTGLAVGTFDVLMFSHTKGIVNTVKRYFFYLGPLVGMATAFSLTTNAAQNIRGKNDHFNYFLGGIAAGSIFGNWIKSGTAAVPCALFLAAAAMIKKSAIDSGFVLNPEVYHASKSAKSVRHDWTLVQDIPELKTYATGKQ